MTRGMVTWGLVLCLTWAAYGQGTRPTTQAENPATRPVLRDKWRHQEILRQTQGRRFDVLFLGDSIIDRFTPELWDKELAPLNAGNFGSSGDKTENLLWRITEGRELEGQEPRLVVLMIGVNNLWGRKYTVDQIVEGIGLIVRTVRGKFRETQVLVLGILPTEANPKDEIRARIKAINAVLETRVDGKAVRFLDIGDQFLEADGSISPKVMADALHPTTQGYRTYLDNVAPVIRQMLGGGAVSRPAR